MSRAGRSDPVAGTVWPEPAPSIAHRGDAGVDSLSKCRSLVTRRVRERHPAKHRYRAQQHTLFAAGGGSSIWRAPSVSPPSSSATSGGCSARSGRLRTLTPTETFVPVRGRPRRGHARRWLGVRRRVGRRSSCAAAPRPRRQPRHLHAARPRAAGRGSSCRRARPTGVRAVVARPTGLRLRQAGRRRSHRPGGFDLQGAIVVGHSMGGAVALALAIERRELVAAGRVAALVVMNSGARGPVDRAWKRAWVSASDSPSSSASAGTPDTGPC